MENPVTHSSQPTLSALESPVFELDAVLFSLVEKPLLHMQPRDSASVRLGGIDSLILSIYHLHRKLNGLLKHALKNATAHPF